MLKSSHWDRAASLMESHRREKLQSMSVEESVLAFCSLMSFALAQRDDGDGWARVVESRWRHKFTARTKLVASMQKENRR